MTGTSMTAASAPDELKRLAAAAAVAEVEDGMVLGLGSGSTAALAVDALGKRVAEEGLKVVGVPTSERTAALARRLGVPLTSFAEHRRIDLTIDGADQVEVGSLNLVKGLGGALLREKIVAAASRRMLVVVDQGKLVGGLGGRTPLPVEIAAFGWQSTLDRLAGAGAQPVLRLTPDGGRSDRRRQPHRRLPVRGRPRRRARVGEPSGGHRGRGRGGPVRRPCDPGAGRDARRGQGVEPWALRPPGSAPGRPG